MEHIKKNEIYDVEITGMTHEGQGVGRINNFTIFVDGALSSETVKALIIKINKSYAIGKLVDILVASPSRNSPFCPIFDKCGGCSIQHMTYEAQLEFKTRLVKDSLKRIGKLDDILVHDTLGMKTPLHYRNKAQYPVSPGREAPAIGFYSKHSHRVVETDFCAIQDQISSRIKFIVKEFIMKYKISVYDENTQTGLLRHVMTRIGFHSGHIMVVLVLNGKALPNKEILVEQLLTQVPQIKSIFLNINTKNTNVILGEKNIKLYGSDTIQDQIEEYTFDISPLSFFQVNPIQTQVLYAKALEYANLSGKETVFDLYCGIGTISIFLAKKAQKVYGVEVVEAAIIDAKKNATVNHIENIEFIAGEAEKVIPDLYEKGIRGDVVVVDPPRKGCDQALLDTLVKMGPKRIVYVSCNPSTLARDLSFLSQNGFKVVEVQPVDMFPHTAHVETVTLITRV